MFKLVMGPDAYLALIEPRHAKDLNLLIKNSYEHLYEWSNWLKNNDQTVDETEEWIRKNKLNFGSGLGYEIGIWHEGNMAGQIGYNYFDRENHRTEIGYWLGESFQGKGLITRACGALIDHSFDQLDIKRIEIRCCTENLKSRKIPEKLGFKLEGVARNAEWLHDRFCDLAIYAMLYEEWSVSEHNG
jgi:ribosomal-protein-serine acetyltransferase